MINKVILLGNLGRDPEVRMISENVKVAQFSLATSEKYRDKDGAMQTKTDWHNITCWRNLADIAERYLKKGSLIYLEGKLSPRKYQDKEGNDRYTVDIIANTVRMLDRRDGSSQQQQTQHEDPSSSSTYKESNQGQSNQQESSAADNENDDLPF